MPRLQYRRWNPGDRNADLAEQASAIARRYAAQGYDMTLRQIFYQLVATDVIPNTMQSYNRLGEVLDAARMGGEFDWGHMVDRTRNLAGNTHWSDPAQIIRATARSYMLDRWADQPYRVEVWVEKEALAGVIGRVASELDLDYFACRGYVSQSEMWRAARRLREYIENGQRVLVLHLGDHDPSGIDMSRDIQDRLSLFTDVDWVRNFSQDFPGDDPLEVPHARVQDSMRERLDLDDEEDLPLEIRRIALNMDQIRQYQPPPNPAKFTDSRAGAYVKKYGDQSWELDALQPDVLAQLIRDAVNGVRDARRWANVVDREAEEREILETTTRRWADVVRYLNDTTDRD